MESRYTPKEQAKRLITKFGNKAHDVVEEVLLVGLTTHQRQTWLMIGLEIKEIKVKEQKERNGKKI